MRLDEANASSYNASLRLLPYVFIGGTKGDESEGMDEELPRLDFKSGYAPGFLEGKSPI
jgi:hypothetical protein